MIRMADIEISLNDTLELDTIIQEWNPDTNLVNITPNDTNNNYTHTGIQTKTSIFAPEDPGVYTVDINGQTLKINVTDPNNISGTVIEDFEDNDLSEYTVSTNKASVSTVSSPVYDGSYALNISVNTSSGGSGIVSSSSGLDIYPERGFPF